MTFILRADQAALSARIEAALAAGSRPCAVAPTGAGKTVLIAETARLALARRERVVAIAHREEIISQIIASLRRHLGPHVRIEAITAGCRSRYQAPVTVGMVPTLARRLPQLAALRGATLLADEAHHMGSTTWGAVTEAIAPGRLCGFTATPVRPDGKGLGDVSAFTELIVGPQPGELMAAGHLCRYRIFAAPRQMDTKGMRKRGGDFTVADMEKRVVEINGDIVSDWRRFNPQGLRTICVGVSVDHAHIVAGLYREEGITAEAVDGTTQKGQRAAIFQRFRSGETTVLCACAVVDEGLDVPEASCLQMTRPTASLRLYRQLVGRVLRPAAGKEEALILDHTDNWRRLPAPDAAIDWQLNQEVQQSKDPQRQLNIDPITNEVTEGEPVPTEVTSNGRQLVEITPELLAMSGPQRARRLLNDRCLADIADTVRTGAPPERLRPWIKRLRVLEDDTVRALGQALGMPPGWSDGQLLLNGLQSTGQRLAMTKHIQGSWAS